LDAGNLVSETLQQEIVPPAHDLNIQQ